jgi:hypothetical protein
VATEPGSDTVGSILEQPEFICRTLLPVVLERIGVAAPTAPR